MCSLLSLFRKGSSTRATIFKSMQDVLVQKDCYYSDFREHNNATTSILIAFLTTGWLHDVGIFDKDLISNTKRRCRSVNRNLSFAYLVIGITNVAINRAPSAESEHIICETQKIIILQFILLLLFWLFPYSD